MLKILLPLFLIASCSSQKELQKGEIDLSILHTNDHHGHFLKDRKAQHGMAARKTLVDEQRASIKKSGGHSLLLSGGDINTGTMESDLFDAEPDFMGMKAIGYDAMALGNHEFDNSFKILKKQQKIAGFPFLSANVFFKGTNKRIFEPYYIVKKMGGLKIGIFGLTTKDTPFKASHMDAGRLFDFKDIITVAKDVVKELKEKEKVDFIIVTTHVGHVGSQTSNGDIKLAKAVPGINVIVGGHSQEVIKAERHGGAIIVQAHEWGKYLGRLDLRISKNAIKMKSYELININKAKKIDGKYTILAPVIKEDPELL
jgi:5'-nucleotidase/UDP-sugar diphosphatase